MFVFCQILTKNTAQKHTLHLSPHVSALQSLSYSPGVGPNFCAKVVLPEPGKPTSTSTMGGFGWPRVEMEIANSNTPKYENMTYHARFLQATIYSTMFSCYSGFSLGLSTQSCKSSNGKLSVCIYNEKHYSKHMCSTPGSPETFRSRLRMEFTDNNQI